MTRDDILRLFTVDVDAGRMFWKAPPKNHSELLGIEAGAARPNRGKSYWVVKIDAKAYKRGRLIFLVAHGRLPSPCIDHINGDSLNDRLINLREATITQNAWNHKKRKRRIALPMGVRSLSSGRYQARIAVNKKMNYLGIFDTPEDASVIYQQARAQYFGEFA